MDRKFHYTEELVEVDNVGRDYGEMPCLGCVGGPVKDCRYATTRLYNPRGL